MGFFSLTSAVTGISIMNQYSNLHKGMALVFPNGTSISGDYDGYGRIYDKEHETSFDMHVISYLFGDVEKYKTLTEEQIEDLRGIAITNYFDKEHPFGIKAMLPKEVDPNKSYEDYAFSKNAEGQGHWLDKTHVKMDEYYDVVGVHTPDNTRFALKKLNEVGELAWEDSSWENDESDSVYNSETGTTIYVPYDKRPTYYVQEKDETTREFYRITDLIDWVKLR